MRTEFNKGAYLKSEFNCFWQEILGEELDFFSKMTDESFHVLKAALSNINNIITYNTTIKAVDKICETLSINDQDKEKIISAVNSTKPNDNGYDIESSFGIPFVCEVKCNRPINDGNRFGSAQKSGIKKDLESLLYGKSKSLIKVDDLQEFYKFMVIYKFDYKTSEAIEHYISLLGGELKDRVILYQEDMKLNRDNIYIMIVE